MVDRRWERARAGEGQFVLIVGEPGIGKSRLVEEFRARLGETRHSWIEWSSSQLLQNTPLHPVLEWGRARFCGPDVPPERRLAEFESVLTQVKLGRSRCPARAAVDIPVTGACPFRRRRFAAGSWRRWSMGDRRRASSRWSSSLRTCSGSTLPRLISCTRLAVAARWLLSSSWRRRGRIPPALEPAAISVISLTPLGEVHVQRMVAEVASGGCRLKSSKAWRARRRRAALCRGGDAAPARAW